MADHVHLAVRLSRTLPVADLVKEIKTASSKWVKRQDATLHDFAWQQGYGVFSIRQILLFHSYDREQFKEKNSGG